LENLVNQWLPSLQHFHYLVYWLAFFAAFLETAFLLGLLIPGSTVLLLLGAYSTGLDVDFFSLWLFAVMGAILGDNLNYFLGKRYGKRLIKRGFWFLKPHHFQPAQHFFDKHGGKSVFLGRFIPSVKELIPFVAGTVGMRQRTFMLWNILGAMGWGLEWLGAGYLFAQSLNIAQLWLPRFGLLLLLLFVIYLLIWGLQRLVIRYGRSVLSIMLSIWNSVRDAVAHNPNVQNLVGKHPHFFSFLHQRLDRTHFTGLSLSLLVLSFVYVLILFGGIVEDLLTTDPIIQLDRHIAELVSVFRAPEVLRLFAWITQLGNVWFVIPTVVLIGTALYLSRRGILLVPLLVSLLGGVGFSALGKLAFERARPTQAVLLEQSYSFPSGHATLSMAFYGFLVYLLIRFSPTWTRRVHLFFAGLIIVFLLGLSRIVLDVHYLSDVLGGYLLGSMWLIIGISLTEWLISNGSASFKGFTGMHQSLDNIHNEKYRKWGSMALLGIVIVYFAGFSALYQPVYAPNVEQPTQELRQPLTDALGSKGLQYTSTLLGSPEQPLGVAILANNDDELLDKLSRAGWQSAQKFNFKQLWQEVLKPDSFSKISLAPVFWNGQINDFALVHVSDGTKQETSSRKTVAIKNTLRIWKSPYKIQGATLYFGVSRDYNGTFWRVFHSVNADIDVSKSALLASLQNSTQKKPQKASQIRENKILQAFCEVDFVTPLTGQFFISGTFFTRGKLILLDLTSAPVKNPYFCQTDISRE
jgi:undecaprenyl-diphosphatase